MSRPYFTDVEWEELLKKIKQQGQRIENSEYAEIIALQPKYEWMTGKKIKPQTLTKEEIVNTAIEMMKGGYKSNQQATADHTTKMFNHSRTQHLAWGGNPATLGMILPKDYIVIDDYPIHPGYRHNKDGYVWRYNGDGWVLIEYYNEEIKMTKKEAIEKALKVTYGGNTHDIINVLEAFGLIKFDEEITEIDILKHYSDSPNAIIYNLDRGGYKIVKK